MKLLKNILRINKKCLWKGFYNMGVKGALGMRRFEKRKKKGKMFPAFHFISVTNDCNLTCQGCWVTKGEKPDSLDISKIDKIITENKKMGSRFFGILGGEPLLYKDLFKIFKNHPDCYFQLFTNGTLLNEKTAKTLCSYGNVTPLISFEGDQDVADIRRGGKNVYQNTIQGIKTVTKHGLITGVAVSVCKSNLKMALSKDFLNQLINMGVLYVWFYIYRPTGADPCYDLALSAEEIHELRKYMVEARSQFPIIIVDSYWRADGEAFCPAAEGLSHHINPSGHIEPCPVIQYSTDQIDKGNLNQIYEDSAFLREFKESILNKTGGCILMEDPQWLDDFVIKHSAVNTSNREPNTNNPLVKIIPSHGSCPKIPEKKWIYRIIKKKAFFGLGTYG